MPEFELVDLQEAQLRSTTGRRAEIIREYLGYLEQLQEEQAGRLHATEGETTVAIRRRLGAAAQLAGRTLVIKRVGDAIYFWEEPSPARGRGRPRAQGPVSPKPPRS